MTIIVPAHRALTSKLAGRSFKVVTRYGYNPWLARVNQTDDSKTSQCWSSSYPQGLISTRNYATTTAKAPVGRPKAHTGRTPARKTTASKPGPKTAEGKSKVGRKPKATSKATTKPKPKPKKKAVAKKAAQRPKKQRTPQALARAERLKANKEARELKEKALLDSPKALPHSAWTVIFAEFQTAAKGSGTPVTETTKKAAVKLRQLTPEEQEHYNHIAHQNKEKNDIAYKKWLGQYTPEQIREANNARRQLKSKWAARYKKTKNVQKYPLIEDDRLVKRPLTAFILYSMERRNSGDFYKMDITEVSKLIGREWQALDAGARKKYDDTAAADLARYTEEVKTVYGQDVVGKKKDTA